MIFQQFLLFKDSADVSKRTVAASALGRAYLEAELDFEDRCAAEAALTVMLDDPSDKVRFALADSIAASRHAPEQVISALVHDQYAIASLVIARSPIIHDRDLVERVKTAEPRLQVIIANRPEVSLNLSKVIAREGCAEACAALLRNANARVDGTCRTAIADRFCDVAAIRGALLADPDLEAELRYRVMKAAGDALAKAPIFGARAENGTARRVVHQAEQRAIVQLAGSCNDTAASNLIEAIRERGDLTTQLLMRTACLGKIDFLAKVLSVLSGQGSERVTAILVNERSSQLNALLVSSGFSEIALPVFSEAIRLWREVAQGRLVAGAQEVTRLVMEAFERTASRSAAANDDILALLRSIYLDTMRDNARRHALSIAAA